MKPNLECLFWETYNHKTGKWTVSFTTLLIVPIFIFSYPTLSPVWDMIQYSEELQLVYQFGNYGIFPEGGRLGYFQPYHEIVGPTTHITNLSKIDMYIFEYKLYNQYNYRRFGDKLWPSSLDLKYILSEVGYREYLLSIMWEDDPRLRDNLYLI